VLPTIVLTELGKRGWSDPVKKANAIKNIPIGRLAGERPLVTTLVYMSNYVLTACNMK